MARYAITDIHGCDRTFGRLLERIGFGVEDELFLLGDYIDRGPDSAGVLRRIWTLQGQGFRVHCLRGNHEQMLIDALQHGHPAWGYLPSPTLRMQTLHWMQRLPHYLETPGYLLAHAGLNFGREDPLSDTEAMLWIREWETVVDTDWLGGRKLLYGHTPRTLETVRQEHGALDRRGILCLDAGCAMDYPGMGYLMAMNLDTGELLQEARSAT